MRRVIRAAAGCGKTTALATAYLDLIRQGHQVDEVIAITFTRRAAAELVERVGLALRAAAGDAQAREALGRAADSYLAAAPSDPDVARRALADLGSAPIGTTDHFVNNLLSEYALHASIELPDGRDLPLDVGLLAVSNLDRHLDAAARALIDPPDTNPPPEVDLLTPYFMLSEIHTLITRSSDLDALEVASCDEVLCWLAREIGSTLRDLDLHAVLRVQEDAWLDAVAKVSNRGNEWTHQPVATWMAEGAEPLLAPAELVPWTRGLHKGRARALVDLLQERAFDFGITQVRMDTVLEALKHPYENPEHLRLADVLRAAVERLRVDVASEALIQAALQGELSHDQATRCAARIASTRELQDRFTAVLVDEIQDANPDQLALYQALANQPNTESVFVGDTRQSIYLFRGGEPAGLERLTHDAQQIDRALTNYRSTPALIAAHRALFDRLEVPLRRQRLQPLEPLTDLEADPSRASDRLDPASHDDVRPVHIVYAQQRRGVETADDEAIRTFWARLQCAWREPGHQQDTAAVLCPTWRAARRARDLLRELAGDDQIAWLQGGDHWLRQGIGQDVRFWLRALSDPWDDIAWLAVLKHPSVGLSDAALARIRASDPRTLGLLAHHPLDASHDEHDRFAFEHARGPLLTALKTIGREDTADVLDALFSRLQWRALLQAGPGGTDDVARLDVLLDWIGDADAAGQGVDAILTLLGEGADVPRVRLDRAVGTVTCTTLFQAKGLAWDHVALLSPGRSGRLEPDPDTDVWIELDGCRKRLVGLRFDPEGGLLPYHDPLRRLIVSILKARYAEEGIRLAYVGITRARRSVTLGLPDRPWRMSTAQGIVCDAWKSFTHPSIAHVEPLPVPPKIRRSRWVVHPATQPFPALDRTPVPRLQDLPPSAAAARYSTEQREQIANHIAARVQLAGGRLDGVGDVPPPHQARPLFTPSDWGTLAHGWFAAWGFKGPVKIEAISAWLVHECGQNDPEVAAWLAELCSTIEQRKGPVWDLIHAPRARLHFEVPVIGLGGPNEELFLAGRPDLVVARGKRVAIVDFKAGTRTPRAGADLIKSANLAIYGPQLEAYREVLERRGLRVDRTILWFVRTGGVVQW